MVIEMSAGLIRGLGTVVVFVAFVGLTLVGVQPQAHPGIRRSASAAVRRRAATRHYPSI